MASGEGEQNNTKHDILGKIKNMSLFICIVKTTIKPKIFNFCSNPQALAEDPFQIKLPFVEQLLAPHSASLHSFEASTTATSISSSSSSLILLPTTFHT